MTIRRDDQLLAYGGSSSAFSSPIPGGHHPHQNGFSTRTRLRPGGPTANFDNPTRSSSSSSYGTTARRNGSLPSFEEISMRTMSNQQQQPAGHQSNFLLNRRPYHGNMIPKASNNSGLYQLHQQPSTPLVKQRTAGCASPRVQMYRTRVVYSDASDAIIKAQEAAV
jgi:hypothetical protein